MAPLPEKSVSLPLVSLVPAMLIPFLLLLLQIRNSSSLLSKITFMGEDGDFLLKRQQALEVSAQ